MPRDIMILCAEDVGALLFLTARLIASLNPDTSCALLVSLSLPLSTRVQQITRQHRQGYPTRGHRRVIGAQCNLPIVVAIAAGHDGGKRELTVRQPAFLLDAAICTHDMLMT
eukprot:4734183-Amphidinium_carterae.1